MEVVSSNILLTKLLFEFKFVVIQSRALKLNSNANSSLPLNQPLGKKSFSQTGTIGGFPNNNDKRTDSAVAAARDKELIQGFKSRAMVAFSMKKYEEAEQLYSSGLEILTNILGELSVVNEKDATISQEAARKMQSNIDECRIKQGLRPMAEEELSDEVW